jgi:hypothetical protein
MTLIEGTTSTGKTRSVLLYRYQLMDCIHLEIISDQRSYAEVNLSDEEAEKLYQALGEAMKKGRVSVDRDRDICEHGDTVSEPCPACEAESF